MTGTDITADALTLQCAVTLGDVDGDGDLDVVAGNDIQRNRLYLNNGTADPFSGVTGTNITADCHETYAIALGDVDGDGQMDVVATEYGPGNHLYRRELFQTSRGMVRSLRVDTEVATIKNARLVPSVATLPNTWLDWYLTNNGGAQWYQVSPGTSFAFPSVGSDLRWKAQLRSCSPHRTPVISQVQLTSSANNAPTLDAISKLTIDEDAGFKRCP